MASAHGVGNLRAVGMILQPGGISIRIGHHGAVGGNGGKSFFRGRLGKLLQQSCRVCIPILGVHEGEQLLQVLPGGIHFPIPEGDNAHHAGNDGGQGRD